jgi:arylsulfatase A-like enzyme
MPKNILLISIDTVRPDYLGAYGSSAGSTPHIDALAERSTVFKQAITNGSYTKPAVPPILSSTYAGMYGGPFEKVNEERPMLARLLQEAGYRTAGFTANPLLGAYAGYQDGFTVFDEPVPPKETRSWLRRKGAQAVLRTPLLNSLLAGLGVDTRPHPVYVSGDSITDLACSFLEGEKRPFFLWVHYMDAHWPYHLAHNLRTGKQKATAWQDLHLFFHKKKIYPGDRAVEHLKNLYRQSLAFLDACIGRLLACLHSHYLPEDTTIVLLADHGEAFYEHGRWQHGAVYDFHEEILRVPLVVHQPGQVERREVTQMVQLIDVAPTVLEMLGLPVHPGMEGSSLLPIINREPLKESRTAIAEMVDLSWYAAAVRTERYKYIYDEKRPGQRELYDLQNDPQENENLAGSLPEVEAELNGILERHLERVNSTSIRDNKGRWQHGDQVVERLRGLGYLD